MIYKSTDDLLRELEEAKRLVRYEPRRKGSAKRRLYLTPGLHQECMGSASGIVSFIGRGFFHAAFEKWVTGGLINADEKGASRFLKELIEPPCADLWEIRITDPRPQGRILGAFVEQDTLVLFAAHTRDHLGDRGSQAWDSAMLKCDSEWTALFGAAGRLRGDMISTYVSANYDQRITLER